MGGVPLPEGDHSVNPYVVVDTPPYAPTAASTTPMSTSGTPW